MEEESKILRLIVILLFSGSVVAIGVHDLLKNQQGRLPEIVRSSEIRAKFSERFLRTPERGKPGTKATSAISATGAVAAVRTATPLPTGAPHRGGLQLDDRRELNTLIDDVARE